MDSSDSGGSMQSSSGGDDQEYDSSPSFLLNQTHHNSNPLLMSSTHVGPIPNPPPPLNHLHHHLSSSSSSSSPMFDPLPSYMDQPSLIRPYSSIPSASNNSLLNLDMPWSKSLRSDPSSSTTDLASVGGGFIFSANQTHNASTTTTTTANTGYPHPPPPLQASMPEPNISTNKNTTTNNHHVMGVRNPKKRSRASRRAPTTVLTTDTSNFRAMVQEFTGIPAPPFTSSPFPRASTRLDLFGTSLRSSPLDASQLLTSPPFPPPYLLRPFPQKIQPPPPPPFLSPTLPPVSSSLGLSTNSLVDAPTTATKMGNPTPNPSSTSMNLLANINQQHHQQNPVLNFQSLLSSSLPFTVSNNIDGSSHLKMGVLEEFGLGHGHVSSSLTPLQDLVPLSSSQETTGLRRDDSNASDVSTGIYNSSQLRVNSTNGKDNNSSGLGFHGGKPPPDHVGIVGTRTSEVAT